MSEPAREGSNSRRELLWLLIAIPVGLVPAILARQGILHVPALDMVAGFVGTIFMRLLSMIVVPLVVASVISGVTSIRGDDLKRLSLATLGYYMLTTAIAVATGLLFVNIMRPGHGIDLGAGEPPDLEAGSLADVAVSIVPKNIFDALSSPGGLLGVIFFSVLIALAAASVGERSEPFVGFVRSFEAVISRATEWILKLTPLGVAALLYTSALQLDGDELARIPLYMLTVVTALLAHGLITLPLLVAVLARRNPFALLKQMARPLVTAFSTASSSATLPLTLDALEENAEVSPRVSRFVVPLGATVNMDGTALYESVAAIFVAQAYGAAVGLDVQIVIFITATLAAVGAAGVPGAGLVTMVIVFNAVGLPLEGIGVLLAVDRILDMTRTAVNVWGDSCGAVVLDARFGDALGTAGDE